MVPEERPAPLPRQSQSLAAASRAVLRRL